MSNGEGFLIQYRKNCGTVSSVSEVIENVKMNDFPSPEKLWECYKKYNGLFTQKAEETSLSTYFFDSEGRSPRYYSVLQLTVLLKQLPEDRTEFCL